MSVKCEIKPLVGPPVFYWISETGSPVPFQKLTRNCESAASEEGRQLGPGFVVKVTSVIEAAK